MRCSSVLVGVCLALALLEVVYLIVRYHRSGTFQTQHTYDPELGWTMPVRFHAKEREVHDALGHPYRRALETNEIGSRLWGTAPGRPKILFIGDSFTEADDVSNDKTYYAVFAERTGWDVFGYGVGGYGTLQEYLALKRLYPLVRPNALVLQFCSNDWMNNYAPWERMSTAFNQRIRPYFNLDEQRIEYGFPQYHPFTLVFRHSALAGWVVQKTTEYLQQTYPGATFEPDPAFHQARFNESVEVTAYLLGRFHDVVDQGTKLFAFNCSEGGDALHQHEQFKRIAAEQGFHVLDGVVRYIESHNSRTVTTLSETGHFNELGNRLLGEWLADHVVQEWKPEPSLQVERPQDRSQLPHRTAAR